MDALNDLTDPGEFRVGVRAELQKQTEWNHRQDGRSSKHGVRLDALEKWQAETIGERRMLVLAAGAFSGVMALLGTIVGIWMTLKGHTP